MGYARYGQCLLSLLAGLCVCLTWGWRRSWSAQSVLTASGSDSQFLHFHVHDSMLYMSVAPGAFSLPASIDYWCHVVVLRNSFAVCRLKSSLTVMLGRVDAPLPPTPTPTPNTCPPPPPVRHRDRSFSIADSWCVPTSCCYV